MLDTEIIRERLGQYYDAKYSCQPTIKIARASIHVKREWLIGQVEPLCEEIKRLTTENMKLSDRLAALEGR